MITAEERAQGITYHEVKNGRAFIDFISRKTMVAWLTSKHYKLVGEGIYHNSARIGGFVHNPGCDWHMWFELWEA